MHDREKVISCLSDLEQIMITRQEICPLEELQYWIELQEGVADALALLKEQEAVEHEWIYKHDNLWYCSRCGEIIYSGTDEDLAVHHAYCSRCGAKMKQEGR